MLSAFVARPIIEFKARDKSKIESVLALGDRIFVGLSTGSLRIYRVTEASPGDPDTHHSDASVRNELPKGVPSVELLREEEKFSRRGVQQLAIIKEASILIALSDTYVSFYDLETYALSERLENTRGATCFATTKNINKDADTGIHSIVARLAVAVKRKILVWTWQDFELTGTAEELTLPATVKSITWVNGSKIVAGMDPGFSMVDLAAQTVSDINRATTSGEAGGPNGTRFGAVSASGMGYMGMGNWVPKPMATRLSEDEIFLVKDVNSLFIDSHGNPLEKRQVPWSAAPDAIGYSYPYLLALQQPMKGALELRNPVSLSLLQSIPVPTASILHIPQPNISLAHAGKGFLVANERCIWRMDAIGYGPQIDELVEAARFDEALTFVDLIEHTLLLDKEPRIQHIKIAKASALFESREYRQALELFSAAPARPDQVISMYPEEIAAELSRYRTAESDQLSESRAEDTVDNSTSSRTHAPRTPQKSRYWPSMRGKDESDTASIRHDNDENEKNDSVSASQPNPLEGRDLSVAVTELCAYLAQTRVQLQKYIDFEGNLKLSLSDMNSENRKADQHAKPPFAHFIDYYEKDNEGSVAQKLFEVATLVDTTLFRAYMLVRPSLAGSLFRLDNFCATNVVQEKLYENKRYSELIDFLWGKKHHEEALQLLQKLGKDESEDHALEGLRGPKRTIQYLQQLPFELIEMILTFAEWPLQVDPDAGIEIFVADTENAESLPRDRVVHNLEKFSPLLRIRYLDHIIHELRDSTTAFHDLLAVLYIDRVKVTKQTEIEGDAVNEWQKKMEDFLRSSRHYKKDTILKQLPADDARFYESRAIVLSKLSFHREALKIYVYQMKDHRKAEEYCNQTFVSLSSSASSSLDPDDDGSKPQSIYTTLLSLYLSPPPPHEQNLEAALDILSLHGSRLPALNTIAALPTSLPIKDLESYFQARMRAATSLAREESIMASLSSVEKSAWEAELHLGNDQDQYTEKTSTHAGRNRRVIMGENRLCPVCHKRFLPRTAFRVYPDGDVLHYGCPDRHARTSR